MADRQIDEREALLVILASRGLDQFAEVSVNYLSLRWEKAHLPAGNLIKVLDGLVNASYLDVVETGQEEVQLRVTPRGHAAIGALEDDVRSYVADFLSTRENEETVDDPFGLGVAADEQGSSERRRASALSEDSTEKPSKSSSKRGAKKRDKSASQAVAPTPITITAEDITPHTNANVVPESLDSGKIKEILAEQPRESSSKIFEGVFGQVLRSVTTVMEDPNAARAVLTRTLLALFKFANAREGDMRLVADLRVEWDNSGFEQGEFTNAVKALVEEGSLAALVHDGREKLRLTSLGEQRITRVAESEAAAQSRASDPDSQAMEMRDDANQASVSLSNLFNGPFGRVVRSLGGLISNPTFADRVLPDAVLHLFGTFGLTETNYIAGRTLREGWEATGFREPDLERGLNRLVSHGLAQPLTGEGALFGYRLTDIGAMRLYPPVMEEEEEVEEVVETRIKPLPKVFGYVFDVLVVIMLFFIMFFVLNGLIS